MLVEGSCKAGFAPVGAIIGATAGATAGACVDDGEAAVAAADEKEGDVGEAAGTDEGKAAFSDRAVVVFVAVSFSEKLFRNGSGYGGKASSARI
ncbi:hypothetical protein OCS_06552 [Ophiocordyceps sinensis CO18]|uniref:Uncharacterized protein n=1 Tax=Ophiocordyceps sinensis (strain Co18 / CGMCC 3.14243) TaxID=911162 RepID=T5A5R4_OPHSC|nr:hypothetical protein OCS_06552 [Ophiocordyceps sinensis CO18]